jgi:hypothetical protein
MEKLSNQKIATVLRDAENALRVMAQERDEALSKLATVERHSLCEKLAQNMQKKGIHTDVDMDSLVGSLEKAAEQGRLPIIQEAVGMMGTNMSFASLNNDGAQHVGSSDFESFIMGDVG